MQNYVVELKEQKEKNEKLSVEIIHLNKALDEKKGTLERISLDYKGVKQDNEIVNTKYQSALKELDVLKINSLL